MHRLPKILNFQAGSNGEQLARFSLTIGPVIDDVIIHFVDYLVSVEVLDVGVVAIAEHTAQNLE